jgi:DNA-binding LacI/PurR family transcriptional regulator
MSPPLTTIRIDIAGLGGRAVRALVRAVGSKNAHERRQEILQAELVVRESCGGGRAERLAAGGRR